MGKLMIDALGRKIDYVRLSLTEACNLRCTYCTPELLDGAEEQLSLDDFLFLSEVMASLGISRVRLTGGEPLLREGLTDFVAALKQIVGIKEVSMTTNGILLKEYAPVLKRAGLDRVNISLDTLRPDRYAEITRGGNLGDVLWGIKAATQAQLTPVKINCVVIGSFNFDEINDFVNLTRNEALCVRFIELMPIGECRNWSTVEFVPISRIKEGIGELAMVQVTGAGPAMTYRKQGFKGTVGFISGVSEHFCTSCNRLRVTSSGLVRACLFDDVEINLALAIKERNVDGLIVLLHSAAQEKRLRQENGIVKKMVKIGG